MSLIVDARAACPAALQRRDEQLDHFAAQLDTQVRAEAPADAPPSAIAAAGIVGGIEALLYARLNRGDTDELQSLLPSLMYFAVLPLRGARGGRRGAGGGDSLSLRAMQPPHPQPATTNQVTQGRSPPHLAGVGEDRR